MNQLSIVIICYIVVLLISIVVVISLYNKYSDLKKNESSSSGNWFGGTFYVNPEVLIPIEDMTEKEEIRKVIINHKKAVLFFWIYLSMLIPIIVLLNSFF